MNTPYEKGGMGDLFRHQKSPFAKGGNNTVRTFRSALNCRCEGEP